MKSVKILLFASLTYFCAACGGTGASGSAIEQAQEAVHRGNYSLAQALCDSIVASGRDRDMSTADLCQLSLLYMRLSENTRDIGDNTAMAARTLQAAMERDADSTLIFVNTIPVEDQARVALLLAITEAHRTPVSPDSLYNIDMEE